MTDRDTPADGPEEAAGQEGGGGDHEPTQWGLVPPPVDDVAWPMEADPWATEAREDAHTPAEETPEADGAPGGLPEPPEDEGDEWERFTPTEEGGRRALVADLVPIDDDPAQDVPEPGSDDDVIVPSADVVPEPTIESEPVMEPVPTKKAKRYLADAAWLGGEALARKVLLEVVDGRFTVVEPGAKPKDAERLRGIVLPGLVSTHSHAFHRLLRGRTHRQGGDFWSWRDRMFEVAVSLDPLTYEDVAAAVFTEMALAGITMVGEFHYLHHRIGGVPYLDPNEMGHAMVRAARRAGIRIGLLDGGYLASGFDKAALNPVQERFSDGTVEAWLDRVGSLADTYSGSDDVRIGVAPHSVRAVPAPALEHLARWATPTTKVHIHVSEQPAENLACQRVHGTTPVGLLARAGLLGPNTTAVHATHLTDSDIATLGATETGVCLCPTTERDLADGIGPSRALQTAGCPITLGTDSNAVIDLFEEARGVELHHRLAAGRRGGFAPATLLEAATTNGAEALGFGPHGLQVGAPADFLRLDARSPRLAGLPARAESVVFAAGAADVKDVYVGGRRVVSDRSHDAWKVARKTLKSRQ